MANEVRRYRRRSAALKVDAEKIVQRVLDFYDQDGRDRDVDLEQRMQRYAKFRMWADGGHDGPWPGSSDVAVSDMTEKSLRMQDTLVNAVMSQRPPVNAKALQQVNRSKEKTIDALLDYQFFDECSGEVIIGDAADAFVNDGVFTAFVPWVKEERMQTQVRIYPGIPADQFPPDYFRDILRNQKGALEGDRIEPMGDSDQPWDFKISRDPDLFPDEPAIEAHFYTRDDRRIECVYKQMTTIFDGPMPRIFDYDHVFHPARAANLQPPGPSNPGGAAHVILRDYPTKDEIRRLWKSKYYDRISKEDVAAMIGLARAADNEDPEEKQKDDLAGRSEESTTSDVAPSQDTLTRLMCFDRYDIDGDGLDEDVIWWVLLEQKKLLKAVILQEMYPSLRTSRPRPLAEASIFPVRGRRCGFSMPELLEGLHDAIKQLIDQAIDSNTMAIAGFGFYRANSAMQSETIRLAPFELYPMGDPSRDVYFPPLGNAQAQGMALNLVTMLQQMGERTAVIGDLQLGRVPAGKSSALRNASSMSLLAGQGEARPERVLRRFFLGLVGIFELMHELDQQFLPAGKQIRIVGAVPDHKNPYLEFQDAEDVGGVYLFGFRANALNTSAAQLQQTLQTLMATYISPLFIQLGISNAETIYNLARDYGQALGADPVGQKYLGEPFPGAGLPSLLAEEAVILLLQGETPNGRPAEPGGWAEHLARLAEIEAQLTTADEQNPVPEISPQQAQLFQGYKALVAQRAAEEQQRAMMAQNAAIQQQRMGGGDPGGRPPENLPPDARSNPPVSGGSELYDESLPGAQGIAA